MRINYKIIEIIGNSMYPSLNSGDLILVKKINRNKVNWKSIQFKPILFNFQGKTFVKRLIGLPNQKLRLSKNLVIVNNERFLINYNSEKEFEWELSDSQIIVLGDNIDNSLDSRKLGPIPIGNIKGYLILKIFPIGKIK